MLWLTLEFPALGREAVTADAKIAVIASHGSHRWLIAPLAVDTGKSLAAGTSLADARARLPDLLLLPRQPEAEQEALQALAHRVYRFGSPVVAETIGPLEPYAVPRWRVSVEIGASLSLFGGVEPLREAVLQALLENDSSARHGIAPSRSAAALLAFVGDTEPCLQVSALRHRLSALPLASLPLPAKLLRGLQGVGLQQLGALFSLPRATLLQRFGRPLSDELDRLLAQRAEPFTAIEPPPVFAARYELHGQIENIETLLFPLKRMTQRFAAYLSARAVTCTQCLLELHHDEGAATRIPLQLLSPGREAERWFEILRERLYRAPPDRAVRELYLRADDFLPLTGSQAALFETHRLSRERQAMLEKLMARYGAGGLWQPALGADHRPEQAWRAGPVATEKMLDRTAGASPLPASRARRPLWLLPQPRPIANPAPDDLPERIETGWWDGAPARRDYHRVRLGGRSAWVYRDLDSNRWHLQGLWE
ncbi:MAG: DNA polymerase Y family protein [Pseudomonadota bacterium]